MCVTVYFITFLLEQIMYCCLDLCSKRKVLNWILFQNFPWSTRYIKHHRWQRQYSANVLKTLFKLLLWAIATKTPITSPAACFMILSKKGDLSMPFHGASVSLKNFGQSTEKLSCIRLLKLALRICNVTLSQLHFIISEPWQVHIHAETASRILPNPDPNAVLWTNIEPSREICLPYKARLKAIKISQED